MIIELNHEELTFLLLICQSPYSISDTLYPGENYWDVKSRDFLANQLIDFRNKLEKNRDKKC